MDIYPFYGSPDVMIYDKQTSLGDTVAGVVVGGGSKEKEGGGGGGESPKLIEAAFQKPLVPITPLLCLLTGSADCSTSFYVSWEDHQEVYDW